MDTRRHAAVTQIVSLSSMRFFKKQIDRSKRNRVILNLINPRYGSSYCELNPYPKEIRAIFGYDNKATKKHLRISTMVFQKIASYLPIKHHGWANELELLILLFWMAAGTSYRVVGLLLNVPITTVFNIVTKMLNFVTNTLLPRIIKFPTSADDLKIIGDKFCQRAGTQIFDCAVGAIDGTHVTITCPIRLHSQYINRKLKYSIQTQAISDSNYKFLDIFIGYPDSVHDTRVLYNSPAYQNRLYPPNGYFLLGDSGYPCRLSPMAIITPFKETHALNDREKTFNYRHSKARTVVECAFGQLKVRWRSIFNKDLELKIENCIKTIAACCVFHNICVDMDDFVLSDPIDEEINNYGHVVDEVDGANFRINLLNNM